MTLMMIFGRGDWVIERRSVGSKICQKDGVEVRPRVLAVTVSL